MGVLAQAHFRALAIRKNMSTEACVPECECSQDCGNEVKQSVVHHIMCRCKTL